MARLLLPRFLGPIRLADRKDSGVQCNDDIDSQFDEAIRAYKQGDDPSLPSHLLDGCFKSAVWLYLSEGCEPARLLLCALSDSTANSLSTRFLTPCEPSFLPILDCLLFPSKDALGMMLDGSNVLFQAHENSFFMELFWTGFVALCRSEKHRVAMSRVLPLCTFVARCPEDLYGFARDLAFFAFVFDLVNEETLNIFADKLSTYQIDEGQKRLVASELSHFLGNADGHILQALISRGVFDSESVPFSSPGQIGIHDRFIDLLTPFISIGYAGAPFWAENLVNAIEEYVEEIHLNSSEEMDTFFATLLYRGCVIAEPFHLARRIITLLLHVDACGCKDSLLSAFIRYLSNSCSAISSGEAKKNHQMTIDKVAEGLRTLREFGVVIGFDKFHLTESVVPAPAIIAMIQKETEGKGLIDDAPFLIIPLDNLKFVEPKEENLVPFYSEFRNRVHSASFYDRYHLLRGMLDPEERHILFFTETLYVCFSEKDSSECPEGARCVLLQSE